jgi:hypothetical protein
MILLSVTIVDSLFHSTNHDLKEFLLRDFLCAYLISRENAQVVKLPATATTTTLR